MCWLSASRGHDHLAPLLGVAWDCGAVTTGPVTVPVLLSLGVGVMDAQRQKRAAMQVLENAALKKSEGGLTESAWGQGVCFTLVLPEVEAR